MQKSTILKIGCKVNLYLKITNRRPDGYHELDTLFYPLPRPFDELHIRPRKGKKGLQLDCSRPELATKSNILYATYQLFGEATGIYPDIELYLQKNIPMGAGLGGGSADAGCFLRWLNLYAGGKPLSSEALIDLAVKIGADVPFFLKNEPAWGRGVGEKLFPASINLRGYTGLLVCPEVHVSTAWAYNAWDKFCEKQNFYLTSQNAYAYKPASTTHLFLVNDFEKVVFKRFDELYQLKIQLMGKGAVGCVLSGSGSSIFALFATKQTLQAAVSHLDLSSLPYTIIPF